jgi:FkbM family methyltransferase
MGTNRTGGGRLALEDDEGDWKDWFKDIVRRNHRRRVFGLLSSAAKTYLRAYHNEDHYRFGHNGELFVIETVTRVKDGERLVAFDVGANLGTWALQLIDCCPAAQLHCFEIAPQLVEGLIGALRDFPNAKLNPVGLSDSEGTLQLKYVPGATSTSTLHEPLIASSWGFQHETVSVPVTTGDKYVSDNAIGHIDILKIDTEGHELSVLKGFAGTLQAGKVSLIQFEHGSVHIAARSLLRDFYQLLGPRGFIIGRLHPRCVDFKDYDHREDEQFRMGNYIAVHRSKPKWIATLQNA